MNTLDLTPSFLEALATPVAWEPKTMGNLLTELGTELRLHFHWDSGAGKEWMELWGENPPRSVALWVNAPLAFVTPNVDSKLMQALDLRGTVVVTVPSWRKTMYSLDIQAIRNAGTGWVKHFWHASDDVVSTAAFSIGELIWATE